MHLLPSLSQRGILLDGACLHEFFDFILNDESMTSTWNKAQSAASYG